MQCHETFVRKIMENSLRQQIYMKMDDVELIGAAPDLTQHGKRAAEMVANPGESQALWCADGELPRRFGPVARK
jgi:hypothetical protein